MVLILEALIALHADEARQDVLIAPAVVAEIAPVIVVATIASNVHHVVNRARPPEDLATRLKYSPTVQMPLRDCPISPIVIRVLKLRVGAGDARQRRGIISPSFDQQDLAGRVLAQPVRQHAAGGPSANDYVIKHVLASSVRADEGRPNGWVHFNGVSMVQGRLPFK